MNIGIVGLGLIGGSIGLRLQTLNHTVFGVVNNKSNQEKAIDRKLANYVTTDLNVLKKCSLIFLALPIRDLINPSKELIENLPKDSIITDVASIKGPIIKTWENLHPLFIGSHPMAGTEYQGVNAGTIDLLKSAKWIITTTPKTANNSIQVLSKLINSMQCEAIFTTPENHDKATSLISHLPIFLASSLIHAVDSENDPMVNTLAKKIASTGFSDTSRVGGGNPFLGVDIAKNNTANIRNSLKKFRENICEIERIFEDSDWDLLQEKLENAANCRELFL